MNFRKWAVLLFIVLTCLQLSFAEEINISKQEYILGETVQAYIGPDNVEISQLSVKDENLERISIGIILISLTQTDNNPYPYFAYFDIPLSLKNGTYFLFIELNKTASLSANFSVSNATFGANIKPPIIDLNKEQSRFEILFTNPSEEDLVVNIISENENVNPIRGSLELAGKESKRLYVDFNPLYENTALAVWYNNISYTIPIIGLKEGLIEEGEQPVQEEEPERAELKFLVEKIEQTDAANITTFEGSIKLQNSGGTSSDIVRLEFTGNLQEIAQINTTTLQSIAPNEIKEVYITINKNKNAEIKEYSGSLKATFDNNFIELPMRFVFVEEEKALERNETVQIKAPNITIVPYTTEGKEEGGPLFGLVISLLLVIIIVIILVKLRKKEKREFKEYIEEVKKK